MFHLSILAIFEPNIISFKQLSFETLYQITKINFRMIFFPLKLSL